MLLYAFAMFGVCLALLTPALVGLALKAREIAGSDGQAAALGLVAGVGAFFALVANPVVGRLSDRTTSRWGQRRPWIIGGVLVGLVALVIVGTATSIAVLLIGWSLAQVGFNATLSAMSATIPDQVPEARRGTVSGVASIASPIAILLGIAAYNVLPFGVIVFAAPGVVAVVLAAVFALTLRDRRITRAEAPAVRVRDLFTSLVFNPRKHPDFGWVWANRFLMFFAYMGTGTYLTYFVIDRFNQTEEQVTGVLLISNLCGTGGMILASLLGGFLSDRFHRRRPFVTIAGLVMVVGLVAVSLADSFAVLYAGQLIMGAGFGAYLAVDLALATLVLPSPDDHAKDLGVLNIAQALPQSIAPAIAPAIIAIGMSTSLGGYAVWYLFGAALAVIGAFLIYKVKAVR
jgi:MFS family permease